jgi:hypothetical protein
MWKPIQGWPYEVSDAGQVRNARTGKILTPMRMGRKRKQYDVVALCHAGKQLRRKVAELVLEAFVSPRPTGKLAKEFGVSEQTICDILKDRIHTGA